MTEEFYKNKCTGTNAGFEKYENNPVHGGDLGTCFDLSMLYEDGIFKMYFSWRDKKSIALSTSTDGIHFSYPEILIAPRPTKEGWEDRISRPSVIHNEDGYHMWYTGQRNDTPRLGTSQIFHAFSTDGVHFERTSDRPVLLPEVEWENTSIMNPSVLYEEDTHTYRMWFSAGAQYEPKAIGYAESKDGLNWTKCADNPIFQANPENSWEQHKTAGCQVIQYDGKYVMFYIGYFDEDYAQIGMAVSDDGIHDWKRYEGNPIVAPDMDAWDGEACYKPFAMQHNGNWYLWYNGRKGIKEQIGLVIKKGTELF